MVGLRSPRGCAQLGYFAKASKVSLEVEKEFINVKARSVLSHGCDLLGKKTMKVNLLVNFTSDLALSMPMPVPNPWSGRAQGKYAANPRAGWR